MAIDIRTIRDDELETVREILDAAYGPSAGRVERVRRYHALGADTWLLASDGGVPAGMAGAVEYDAFAYVGLVGVVPAAQRRGIALALMRRLLALLESRGRATVLLDASEVGAPLYDRLGFVVDDVVRLWTGVGRAPASSPARPMARGDLAAVARLDRRASGADRTRLLGLSFDDLADRAFVVDGPDGEVAAFALAQTATVGPWIAADDAAAEAVLAAALSCDFAGGAATIAVPGANGAAAAILERRGFEARRELPHMRLGPPVARRRGMIYGQASLTAG